MEKVSKVWAGSQGIIRFVLWGRILSSAFQAVRKKPLENMEMASFSRLLNPSPLKGSAFPHPQKRETEMQGR